MRRVASAVAGLVAAFVLLVAPAPLQPVLSAEKLGVGPVSGLPLPRFVSLKSDRVNVRGGPTKDHDVVWIYTRSGLPVEVTAEFDNWRRIRDWEGAEGWVFHSMLSGRRTGIVTVPRGGQTVPLHRSADASSLVEAQLEPGVVTQVRECSGQWCRVRGEGFDGFVRQERLFGVYPNEPIE
jgi:SH3-like domain-containing protein